MNQEFIDQLAEKLQKVGTIHAIGETWISIDSTIPAGGIPFLGQLVSRAAWADLFAWATAKGLVKTEDEWQALATSQNGNVPFYSDGDGSTTFRMPKIVGYLKGASSLSEAGTYTAEGLPNIEGQLGLYGTEKAYCSAAGAFSKNARAMSYGKGHNASDGLIADFSAENSNPIYGNSEHVTPETYNVIVGVYAVGIVTRTGSTDLDAVLTGIAQAEETANNVSNTLANNLGNLAKLQSFFNGTFSKTLLAGGTEKADWIGYGNITLADSWKNYDALLGFATNDSNTSHVTSSIIFRWQLEALIEIAKTSGKAYFMPFATIGGHYYSFSPTSTTEIAFMIGEEDSGIQAIYGLKLKGTGVTNAKAVDVSDVQARLAGMLTDDNHLVLPSGLEVW